MPVASRNSGCGNQSENDARHSYALEGQNITNHKVQPLVHKALFLSVPHPEDEDIFGTRGKPWSQTPAVTNPATSKYQQPQSQNIQHPQPQNTQHPQSFDVPDRYSKQIQLRRERQEKIEQLNEKYNLDYYSSLDSDSKLESEYRYEHKYETFI